MPTTDRVLVEIVTAANMTGIKEAQAGFLGMSNALTATIAGLGLAVVAGKSAIEIAEKHQNAESDLMQAVNAYNSSLKDTLPTTAKSAEEIAKLKDTTSKTYDSLVIASNGAAKAQFALSDAIRKHGAHSEQAAIATRNFEDANIRLRQAQEANTDATKALSDAQAILPGKLAPNLILFDQLKASVDSFIASNRSYISDQAEVITGFATLTRAGLDAKEVQLDMNRALDLAAVKHISLGDAVALVNAAEHGRLKGLVDLGITSKAYVDSSGNVVEANKNMALVMAELDAKTAHGRETTSQMTEATNRLSNDWQDIANNVGPPLLGMLDGILQGADWLVQKLKELGENKDWNKALTEGFGAVQGYVTDTVQGIRDLIAGVQWLIDHGEAVARFLGAGTSSGGRTRYSGGARIAAASGFEGTVSQPTLFLAGEGSGSEHVRITPSGAGGSAHITVNINNPIGGDGPYWDNVANRIANRLGYATGR